eukprot:scaffold2858_cov115-Skeletonema_dohrnii-CCMP3373.AAC.1
MDWDGLPCRSSSRLWKSAFISPSAIWSTFFAETNPQHQMALFIGSDDHSLVVIASEHQVPVGIAPSGQLARQNLDWEGCVMSRGHAPFIFDFSASLRSTYKIILALSDMVRYCLQFQTLRRIILIIKLMENFLPIDA